MLPALLGITLFAAPLAPSVDVTGPAPQHLAPVPDSARDEAPMVPAQKAPARATPAAKAIAPTTTWMPTLEQTLVAIFDDGASDVGPVFRIPAVVVQSPNDRELGLELERQLATALVNHPRAAHCLTSTDLAYSSRNMHAPEVLYDAGRRKGATDIFIVRLFPNREVMLVQRLSASGVESSRSMPFANPAPANADVEAMSRSRSVDAGPIRPAPTKRQMQTLRENALAFVPEGRTAVLGPIRTEPFLVRTPDASLLESEDALRAIGETEMADRRGLATASQPWLILGSVTAITVLSVGLGVTGLVLYRSQSASNDWTPRDNMAALTGATLGAGMGLPLALASRFIPALITPSAAEVQNAIRLHNIREAKAAGVDVESIPFKYLGY